MLYNAQKYMTSIIFFPFPIFFRIFLKPFLDLAASLVPEARPP